MKTRKVSPGARALVKANAKIAELELKLGDATKELSNTFYLRGFVRELELRIGCIIEDAVADKLADIDSFIKER